MIGVFFELLGFSVAQLDSPAEIYLIQGIGVPSQGIILLDFESNQTFSGGLSLFGIRLASFQRGK